MPEEYTTIPISQPTRTELKIMTAERNIDYETLVKDLIYLWKIHMPYKNVEEFKKKILSKIKKDYGKDNIEEQNGEHILIKFDDKILRYQFALLERHVDKKDIDGVIIPLIGGYYTIV